MIDGVITKQLVTHADERGFFREIIRATDDFFAEGFGQWSDTEINDNVIKAWHYHLKQTDYFYCNQGVIKVVLCDIRPIVEGVAVAMAAKKHYQFPPGSMYEIQEFLLGDNHPPIVLKIPPGVAHGLKVLKAPAHLTYITSRVYDPEDEGRIPYNSLGYDWLKGPEIK